MEKKRIDIWERIAIYLFIGVAYVVLFFAVWLSVKYGYRIFIYDTFIIPTNSMQPTLQPGDKIYADKLAVGARIYKDIDSALYSTHPETFRVPGLRGVRHNDVLVFSYPFPHSNERIEMELNYVYCKRCVGIPGDTMSIVDGLFKNSNFKGDELGYVEAQRRLAMTPDSVHEWFGAFPHNDILPWTIKNFGPLYIPECGDVLPMDSLHYLLYKLPIEYETRGVLSLKDGVVYLNDEPISEYEFKSNYYFMVGDNVFNSRDSRYWGLLPGEFIVGVVDYILYSKSRTSGEYRWDRFLKPVE